MEHSLEETGRYARLRRTAKYLIPGVMIAALMLAVVPILLVGDCVHPFGDDYAYSISVHQALESGASVLSALWGTIRSYYFGWQGTYSAAVLMALQPGVWSEGAYALTPVILLAMLLLPTGLLAHTVLRRWLGLSRGAWLGAAAGLGLVTVLYQPSVLQAFFWWNGGVYYTFFYGLMLLLVTCMVRLRLAPSHPRLLTVAALLLAAVIGGGNYVTGLFCCLLLGGYALVCLIWDRPRLRQPLSVGAVLAAGFLVNILAPGNAVRQAESMGMSASGAVWQSLVQAARDCYHWLTLPAVLGLAIALAPLLWRAAGRTRFSFPWPGAATLLLFLALACQNAPHFFAMASAGPGRLRNIVFDSFLWLILLGEGYWLGWLRHRFFPGRELLTRLSGALAAVGLALCLLGVCLNFSATAPGQCASALADSSARAYDACVGAWVEELSTSPDEDVILRQPAEGPGLLYLFTLTDNPNNFANVAAANYYGKQSVIALPAEKD